jgi:hypothetical protein
LIDPLLYRFEDGIASYPRWRIAVGGCTLLGNVSECRVLAQSGHIEQVVAVLHAALASMASKLPVG